MGIISSNCKNKPSKFISLSATTPPFSHKKLETSATSASTDNLTNLDSLKKTENFKYNLLNNSSKYLTHSMNNSDNKSFRPKKKEISNSKAISLNGNRLELPSRINKSNSVSDIIFLNNKDNVVQLTTGTENDYNSPNIIITVKKSRRKSKRRNTSSSKITELEQNKNLVYGSGSAPNSSRKKRSVSRKSTSFEYNTLNNKEIDIDGSSSTLNNLNANEINTTTTTANHKSRRNYLADDDLLLSNKTLRKNVNLTNKSLLNSNHYHYYHHHHHHHHHSIEVEESSKLNNQLKGNQFENVFDDEDMSSYSQSLSLKPDAINRKFSNRTKASIFDSLYNQVTDTQYKVVNEDSSASIASINNGSSSMHGDRTDDYNNPSNKNYLDLSQFDSLPLIDHLDAIKCSKIRLKKIQSALDEPDENFFQLISKDDLKRNLDYFVQVLDNVIQDERKQVDSRLMSDDDVLSEVEPNTVPNEVRNWLSMTFTRSVSNMKKKNEDKPKFKSVAQAIRAGIMVDRMLRRMSSSLESNVPAQVSKVLKTLNDWNFEVFSMNECSDGQALRYLGFELMQKFNILQKFKIQNLVMQNFLEAMETGYSKHKNPYHNLIHAADVLQTTYHMINNAGLMTWLSPLEIFAVFVSAIIHDYEHTGTTNNFHMQTRSEYALIYNDRAVLENYHISASFKLMTNDSCNIIQELTREEYKEFRSLVIEMVLATDMSYHFTQLKTVKNMISLNENLDKMKALSLVLHCADISHPSKHWPLHEKWTNLLVEEFFAQGDKEKALGLPFSPLCDRSNTPIAQSQIGFINFIVEPSMCVMGDMIDKIFEQILSEEQSRASKSDITDSGSESMLKKKPIERPWAEFLSENKSKWQVLADAEKQKLELLKQQQLQQQAVHPPDTNETVIKTSSDNTEKNEH